MKRLSLQKYNRYIWQRAGWPNFFYNNNKLSAILNGVRFSQGVLLGRMRELGFDLGEEARAEILASEAVKTSAVEGTILNLDFVRSSVARRLGLPNAGLFPADRYVEGIVDVLLDATNNFNSPLTAERLCGWQAALFPTGFSGMHRINAGKWRGDEPMRVVSGPMGREKIHFEAPPHDKIGREIKYFLKWWSKSHVAMDGLLRAGIAHFYFVTIHPFEDGNGRIARALTDMALAQDEKSEKRFYSLSTQIMAERKEYYDVLESAQKGGLDITNWLAWFLQCAKRSIENSGKIVSRVLAKSSFWKKYANVEINGRQRKVVNLLLDAGQGNFEGGITMRDEINGADVPVRGSTSVIDPVTHFVTESQRLWPRRPEETRPSQTRRENSVRWTEANRRVSQLKKTSQGAADEGNAADAPFISSRPLTTRKYASIAKVSRVTAYREISDLLEKGLLRQNEGKGRNTSYDVDWGYV